MRRHRPQAGFTLLEILVAFVVLALVGGALLQLFQGGLQNLAAGEGHGRAALLAESTLSQLRAAHTLSPGEQRGELEPGYNYRLVLAPYLENGEPRPALLQADLQISWDEGARSYQLRTLVLPPGGTGEGG